MQILRERVRYIFGFSILITHFFTIGSIFILGISRLEGIAEVAGAVLTVTPLTSLYFTAFLRYVVFHDNSADTSTMSIGSFSVQLIVVLLFSLCLLGGTSYLFIAQIIDLANIGVYTGLIETLFALYMGIIFNSLFPDTMPPPEDSATRNQPRDASRPESNNRDSDVISKAKEEV